MNRIDFLPGEDQTPVYNYVILIYFPSRFSESHETNRPYLGDHVDILGRSSLNDLILRVAGGKGYQIDENYVSKIREYSDNVKIFEE